MLDPDDIKLNPLESRGPSCPYCSERMVKREAKRGRHAGRKFWGCMNFSLTGCSGTLPEAVGDAIVEREKEVALERKVQKAEAEARLDHEDMGFINFIDME